MHHQPILNKQAENSAIRNYIWNAFSFGFEGESHLEEPTILKY